MFKSGDTIGVPCDVMPGPFSGEMLITFETIDGPISGFVNQSELKAIDTNWYVRCIIKTVSPGSLEVWVNGSFFTTNGLANVPPDIAVAA